MFSKLNVLKSEKKIAEGALEKLLVPMTSRLFKIFFYAPNLNPITMRNTTRQAIVVSWRSIINKCPDRSMEV